MLVGGALVGFPSPPRFSSPVWDVRLRESRCEDVGVEVADLGGIAGEVHGIADLFTTEAWRPQSLAALNRRSWSERLGSGERASIRVEPTAYFFSERQISWARSCRWTFGCRSRRLRSNFCSGDVH